MANALYDSMQQNNRQQSPFGSLQKLANDVQQLKLSVADPNQKIQELLNSGRVSQQDYNIAVQKYNQMRMIFGG